jgi:hypothetical protein
MSDHNTGFAGGTQHADPVPVNEDYGFLEPEYEQPEEHSEMPDEAPLIDTSVSDEEPDDE